MAPKQRSTAALDFTSTGEPARPGPAGTVGVAGAAGGFGFEAQHADPTAFGDWRSVDWPSLTRDLVAKMPDEVALRRAMVERMTATATPYEMRRLLLDSAVGVFRRARGDADLRVQELVEALIRRRGTAERTELAPLVGIYGQGAVAAALKRIPGLKLVGSTLFLPPRAGADLELSMAKAGLGNIGATLRAAPVGTQHQWLSHTGGVLRAVKEVDGHWRIVGQSGSGHPEGTERGAKLSSEQLENKTRGHRHMASEDEDGVRKSERPESDSAYADPERRAYPVDTYEHTRAAISYFSMPKNHSKYPPDKRSRVWGRIRAAAKRHGIEISEGSGPGSHAEKGAIMNVNDLDKALAMMKAEAETVSLATQECIMSPDDKPVEQQLTPGEPQIGGSATPPAADDMSKAAEAARLAAQVAQAAAGQTASEQYVAMLNAGVTPGTVIPRDSRHVHAWSCSMCKAVNSSIVSVCKECGGDHSGTDGRQLPTTLTLASNVAQILSTPQPLQPGLIMFRD